MTKSLNLTTFPALVWAAKRLLGCCIPDWRGSSKQTAQFGYVELQLRPVVRGRRHGTHGVVFHGARRSPWLALFPDSNMLFRLGISLAQKPSIAPEHQVSHNRETSLLFDLAHDSLHPAFNIDSSCSRFDTAYHASVPLISTLQHAFDPR